jgi:putative transposase
MVGTSIWQLLADQYYCSYFMICLLLAAGVDFVTRLHHLRKSDLRRGQRLAAGDHVVQWFRPAKPAWMDQATYEQMPQSITIREVEFCVAEPGFRVERLVVVTTLTDARQYTRSDLAQLYRGRWLAELDIRAIKVTLGIDVLRCKSPEMVRRELWASLLAYNLVRQSILSAAKTSVLSPRQLSFTAALQQIAASWTVVVLLDHTALLAWIEQQQRAVARHRVGDRPDRVEPRAIKRRPKPHKLLTKPRKETRAELLAGTGRAA